MPKISLKKENEILRKELVATLAMNNSLRKICLSVPSKIFYLIPMKHYTRKEFYLVSTVPVNAPDVIIAQQIN